jgi:hypothetical protein
LSRHSHTNRRVYFGACTPFEFRRSAFHPWEKEMDARLS